MRGFRRRKPAPATAAEQLGVTGRIPAEQTGRPAEPRAARMTSSAWSCRITASAAIRRMAARGGPLVRRFFSLRESLPRACDDPADEDRRRRLDAILHHHALAVWVAMDLLACEWRSERIARQLDALDGLGTPAIQLDELYAELAGRSTDHAAEAIRATAS